MNDTTLSLFLANGMVVLVRCKTIVIQYSYNLFTTCILCIFRIYLETSLLARSSADLLIPLREDQPHSFQHFLLSKKS